MALNLVSSYASDVDSEHSGADEATDLAEAAPSDGPEINDVAEVASSDEPEKPEKKISSCLFGGGDGSSSEDDSGPPKDGVSNDTKPSSGTAPRLPSAGSVLKATHVGSSIFSSEREREDAAHAITLSQHVPLTEKQETEKKPLCRAFARGDCRRGGKCRYAHPKVPVVPPGVATVGVAPRMYDANDIDEIFAKKPKIA